MQVSLHGGHVNVGGRTDYKEVITAAQEKLNSAEQALIDAVNSEDEGALILAQARMQKMNRIFAAITQTLASMHQTAMSVINNLGR